MNKGASNNTSQRKDQVRIPADSLLFERIVPALLIILAFVTVVIVLVALGFLIGLVPYQ